MKDAYLEISSTARSEYDENDRVGMITVFNSPQKTGGIQDIMTFDADHDGCLAAVDTLNKRFRDTHFMPLDHNNEPFDTGELSLAEVIEMFVAASIKKFVESC